MWQRWRRVGLLSCVLLAMGAAWTTGAGAQDLPIDRLLPPPTAVWKRGFTSITSVRELDGGRTLVADRGERSLYLVNWETGAVDQLLRRGEGPGEYQEIGWLYAVGDNETLLTAVVPRRWILLRDTKAAHTFTRADPLISRFRSRLDGVATGGRVLASVSAERPGSLTADTRVIELTLDLAPHEDLPRLDTIARVSGAKYEQRRCVVVVAGGGSAPPPCNFLEAEEQALIFPDGWVAIALQDPYRVFWHSPDGDLIQGEALADGSVPVTDAEKCAALNGWAEGGAACDAAAVERLAWPDKIPPFLTDSRTCRACWTLAAGVAPWLFADPGGRLVVRRTPHLSRRENRYDVFDRTGQLVERVTLPHGQAIVGFGASSVYTIRMDQYDLQWLLRHPWRD